MSTPELSPKSPFPGMDPYLEKYWDDVHHKLTTYACDQLQPALPQDLRARADQRVFVDTSAPIAEPLLVQLADEPISQGFIQMKDVRSGGRVVTVIEIISPSNKVPGPGQDLYLKKQREVLASGANLVEIDLTRAGNRGAILPMAYVPPSHRTTFAACVRRATKPFVLAVYRLPLTQRLPAIAVPLRETDADVRLDLQSLVDLCYKNGRYEDIDYKVTLDPPLTSDDKAA